MSTTFRLTDKTNQTHACIMVAEHKTMGIFTVADDKCVAIAQVDHVHGAIVVATTETDARFDPTTVDHEMQIILQRAAA